MSLVKGVGLALGLYTLVIAWPAVALDPNKAITQYMHDVYRQEQGFAAESVLSIYQTRDGYLWIGTLGGGLALNRVRSCFCVIALNSALNRVRSCFCVIALNRVRFVL
jgi:ligand-binding sensor domain-containing protein